jgi:hypothetical protein
LVLADRFAREVTGHLFIRRPVGIELIGKGDRYPDRLRRDRRMSSWGGEDSNLPPADYEAEDPQAADCRNS